MPLLSELYGIGLYGLLVIANSALHPTMSVKDFRLLCLINWDTTSYFTMIIANYEFHYLPRQTRNSTCMLMLAKASLASRGKIGFAMNMLQCHAHSAALRRLTLSKSLKHGTYPSGCIGPCIIAYVNCCL